jgi:hypothetical protein
MSDTPKIDTNLASRSKYQIQFKRLPNVVYNATKCRFPSVTLGVAGIETPFKRMGFAGTKIEHDDFSMQFNLNEDHSNYMEILHWMEGAGFPEEFKQHSDLIEKDDGIYSDFTVSVFSNAGNPVGRYTFTQAFPTNLSALEWDSQDSDDSPQSVNVSFEFMLFKFERL